MKRIIPIILLIVVVLGGGIYFFKHRAESAKPVGEKAAAEKPTAEEGEKTHVTRDETGRVVVHMDDETQGNIGILVAKPTAAQLSPEVKGYGRVLDPTPLAALMTEMATARAAYAASSNELARLKILAAQGNAPERALQTGEALALRDQLAIQSARDRLSLSWGKAIAGQSDLPAFVQALTSQSALLARIDLPLGETLASPPTGARLVTLAGVSLEADLLGAAANVDPLTQGRGFIFQAKPKELQLLPGEALTGFLKIPGEPLAGVLVPRAAVVRTEGAGWVYRLDGGSESFTRIQVPLDHPNEAGWFVATGISTNEYLVVTGTQILLSEELKASIKAD
ncbi:MAG: hypothetical protein HY043_23720 [Verrucomicrobia bacterium]|nr:hypothetical protein [Verrucomicrobiota bacterium]